MIELDRLPRPLLKTGAFMGAELFYHTSAYTSDPREALELLQAAKLDEYDLMKMVTAKLTACQKAFDLTPEDDEYGLHDHYKAELERARIIASEPIPCDFRGRLEHVRRLHADTGQGVGNILDVDGIASDDDAGWAAARLLTPVEIVARFGAEKLLASKVSEYASEANGWLGRGECICVPLYASPDDHVPEAWCFVGNTVD